MDVTVPDEGSVYHDKVARLYRGECQRQMFYYFSAYILGCDSYLNATAH